jgi:hypothetical protein
MGESLRPRRGPVSGIPPLPTFGGSGVVPGVDLADFRSLTQVMDEGTPVDALRFVNVLVYAHRIESPRHDGAAR